MSGERRRGEQAKNPQRPSSTSQSSDLHRQPSPPPRPPFLQPRGSASHQPSPACPGSPALVCHLLSRCKGARGGLTDLPWKGLSSTTISHVCPSSSSASLEEHLTAPASLPSSPWRTRRTSRQSPSTQSAARRPSAARRAHLPPVNLRRHVVKSPSLKGEREERRGGVEEVEEKSQRTQSR